MAIDCHLKDLSEIHTLNKSHQSIDELPLKFESTWKSQSENDPFFLIHSDVAFLQFFNVDIRRPVRISDLLGVDHPFKRRFFFASPTIGPARCRLVKFQEGNPNFVGPGPPVIYVWCTGTRIFPGRTPQLGVFTGQFDYLTSKTPNYFGSHDPLIFHLVIHPSFEYQDNTFPRSTTSLPPFSHMLSYSNRPFDSHLSPHDLRKSDPNELNKKLGKSSSPRGEGYCSPDQNSDTSGSGSKEGSSEETTPSKSHDVNEKNRLQKLNNHHPRFINDWARSKHDQSPSDQIISSDSFSSSPPPFLTSSSSSLRQENSSMQQDVEILGVKESRNQFSRPHNQHSSIHYHHHHNRHLQDRREDSFSSISKFTPSPGSQLFYQHKHMPSRVSSPATRSLDAMSLPQGQRNVLKTNSEIQTSSNNDDVIIVDLNNDEGESNSPKIQSSDDIHTSISQPYSSFQTPIFSSSGASSSSSDLSRARKRNTGIVVFQWVNESDKKNGKRKRIPRIGNTQETDFVKENELPNEFTIVEDIYNLSEESRMKDIGTDMSGSRNSIQSLLN